MAYYLGRDVKVYIAAEHGTYLYVNSSTLKGTSAGGVGDVLFANSRANSMYAEGLVTDLTGVDLGIGATDEDISFVYTGLEKPTQNYGYRLHIQLKTSGEIFVVRNAQITGHTTSISVDGVQEETLEFISMVDPKIVTAAHNTVTGDTAL